MQALFFIITSIKDNISKNCSKKENNIPVKLEELKVSIREHQEKAKEKYSFILPFNQNISLKEHLEKYKKQVSAREKKSLKLIKKQEKKETKNKR